MYVGNIAWAMKDSDLKCLFSQYGEVNSAKVITQPSGKSRGYGFVEMDDDNAAANAIASLHKMEVFGRSILVTVSKKSLSLSPNSIHHGM